MAFAVRLVDAQFPPYSQVIPQQSEKLIRVPRAAFAVGASRAVSVAASERTGGVKLSVSQGTMRISTESPDSGEGSEVPIDYAGAPMTIGFNARFPRCPGLARRRRGRAWLWRRVDPAVPRPTGHRQFLAVVMPMRI